jgi:hypothetical protein
MAGLVSSYLPSFFGIPQGKHRVPERFFEGTCEDIEMARKREIKRNDEYD